MKATDSIVDYKSALKKYTNYTVGEIKKICKEIGPRSPGTESERKTQEHFKEEMKACSDKVEFEEFSVHPMALGGWVLIVGVCQLLAVLFSFLNLPIVTLVLSAISLICMLFEMIFYWEFLDPIFPKKTSSNVYGVRKPTGEVKQRIIFSGHADSAFEMTYNHIGGHILVFAVGVSAVVGMFYTFFASIIQIIMFGVAGGQVTGFFAILRFAELLFIPSFIAIFFFSNFKRIVPGANDNLTGAITAISVLKYLEDNNIRFENTEVVALTTGSEEAGLRGAKNFTKAHLKELKEIPTAYFGMDTLRDFDDMAIYNKDLSGTIKTDKRVCALMKKASERAGLDLPFSSVYFGASDAAAVTKLGVPAATLAAQDPTPPRYYHTRGDTADNLDPRTIEAGFDVCLQALFLFDEQGLVEEYK